MKAQAATPHKRAERDVRRAPPLKTRALGGGQQQLRNLESRVGADQDAAEQRRRPGRDDDRQEGPVRHFGQQDFRREQNAPDRRVEGRGDARAGSRREQGDLLPGREPQPLRESRTQRGADLG